MALLLATFAVALTFAAVAPPSAAAASPEGDLRAPILARLVAGRFAAAESLAQATLRSLESEGRGDSLETAQVLDLLVDAMRQGGKAADPGARALARRALALKERRLGPDDPDVATSLTSLANLLSVAAEFDEAKPLHERALAIRERRFGPESVEAARSLNNLGNVLNELGDLDRAAELHRRALSIRERLLGPANRDVAGSLNNLAKVELAIGAYDSAQAHYEHAVSILREAAGPRHPDVGRALANLGLTLYYKGDDASARERLEEALAIQTEALGGDHPFVAFTLNQLGVLLADLGDTDAARAKLTRALAIRRRTLRPDDPDLGRTLFQLARVDAESGRPRAAKGKAAEALAIYARSDAGPEQANAAAALHLLGSIHVALGDRRSAVACFDSAAAIWTARFGPDHPFLAQVWCDLGALRLDQGDARSALELYERAEAIETNALGANHPNLASTLRGEALADLRLGNADDALSLAVRAEAISREHVRLAFRALAEREALRAVASREGGLPIALGIAARSQRGGVVRSAWNELIRSRALVLDEVAERHRAAARNDGAAGAEARAAYAGSAGELARLLTRGAARDSAGRYRTALARARGEYELAERALAARTNRAGSGGGHGESVDLERVVAGLPRGSALVAYALYMDPGGDAAPESHRASHVTARGGPAYVAFVASADTPGAVAVPLGAAAPLEALADHATHEAAEGPLNHARSAARALADYRRAGAALRRVAWDPVAKAIDSLGGARTVFIVPDGRLALVPFWALPEGADRFLLDAGWRFHTLACERDLLDAGPGIVSDPDARRLLAVGGPDFDAVARGRRASAAPDPAYAGDCSEFRSLRFRPLPGSAAEARDVVAIWNRTQGGGVGTPSARDGRAPGAANATLLVGTAADEGTLKALAPAATTLHLATHGFFLDEDCRTGAGAGSTRGIGILAPSPASSPRRIELAPPLLLSGLALAGANQRNAARPGEEDGVLTAEEIAALDLSRVEWAVLSACDTGRGRLEPGEGIFGLRRAFRVAGARTLVLSLWALDDQAAREWIRALCDARWHRGSGALGAWNEATREVLEARRQEGRSVHPFYWAGFVATGDWR